jgi:chromosome segregation ATPase
MSNSTKDLLLEKINNKVDSLEKEAKAEEAKVEEAKAKAKDEEATQKIKEQSVKKIDALREKINEANKLGEEIKSNVDQGISDLEAKVSNFFS